MKQVWIWTLPFEYERFDKVAGLLIWLERKESRSDYLKGSNPSAGLDFARPDA